MFFVIYGPKSIQKSGIRSLNSQKFPICCLV